MDSAKPDPLPPHPSTVADRRTANQVAESAGLRRAWMLSYTTAFGRALLTDYWRCPEHLRGDRNKEMAKAAFDVAEAFANEAIGRGIWP